MDIVNGTDGFTQKAESPDCKLPVDFWLGISFGILMKLSHLLVTVNLIATLPVAAQAAKEAVSDKTEWVKRNLACLDSAKKSPTRKVSLSDPGFSTKARNFSLRPFVPNRHLPSKKELETVLLSQQARMEPRVPLSAGSQLAAQTPITVTQSSPLVGQVAVYSIPELTEAPRISVRSYPQGLGYQSIGALPIAQATRAIPGRIATLPGQVAGGLKAVSACPLIPEPGSLKGTSSSACAEYPTTQNGTMDEDKNSVTKPSKRLVEAPTLTADEQSLLNELVELNYPGRFKEFHDLSGREATTLALAHSKEVAQSSSAGDTPTRPDIGPPPFPLNLLPPDALQDLVGRKSRKRIDAPPAYFGSWHAPIVTNTLPQIGFQSHIASCRITQGNFSHFAPLVAVPTNSKLRQRHSTKSQRQMCQANLCSGHVATYPSYEALSLYGPYESRARLSMF